LEEDARKDGTVMQGIMVFNTSKVQRQRMMHKDKALKERE
jgi:hypothetical protein